MQTAQVEATPKPTPIGQILDEAGAALPVEARQPPEVAGLGSAIRALEPSGAPMADTVTERDKPLAARGVAGTSALHAPAASPSRGSVSDHQQPVQSSAPQRRRGPPSEETAARAKAGLLLNVHAAASYLGLSASTLNKMRCTGAGPRFLTITRAAVHYEPADLDAWIAVRRRGSTSESP